MLVVDLLHEFELGVWKSLFMQLIRLLYAAGKSSEELGSEALVTELDSRFVYKSFDINKAIHMLLDTAKSQHLALVPFECSPRIRQK